ncbi:MAG: hypothetical protein K6E91_02895 [Butyrivibrio sp.]|nr:hypothetical protein [Butyrivibrio sp.]
MNVALNMAYSVAKSQRTAIKHTLSAGNDFERTLTGATDAKASAGVNELHSSKDCAPGEVYSGYAVARKQGDSEKPSCNFYKPADYNDADPVIIAKMYPGDEEDAVTREIHINDVNLSNADYYETFAYGMYLQQKGEISSVHGLMTAHSVAAGGEQSGSDLNGRDVTGAIIKMVNESYDAGDYSQYMDYLKLLNAVKGRT